MAIARVEADGSGDAQEVTVGAYHTGGPKLVFDDAWTATHTPMTVLLAFMRARDKIIQYMSGR